jgi:predicted RNA binding protein YcfA (HicA-like mRNA interferase family)
MKHDLERMRANPGSVDRRDLISALRERGYVLARQGKHEIWSDGRTAPLAIPRTLKGTGTVRKILDQMIEAEERDSARGRSR